MLNLKIEFIIKKIEYTFIVPTFSLKYFLRTRIFMTDIYFWQEMTEVHSYLFEDVKQAFTLIEVSNLIDPDLLLEIQATAIKEDT